MPDALENLALQEQSDLCTRSLYVRALRPEARSVDVVASTDAVDSYGEIVEQSWILDRYLKNPVVLWNHNKLFQQDTLPIGKASDVRVESGRLIATITFASAAANPKAEQVWQSFKEGTLRAVSVGFNPRNVRSEKRDGNDVYVLSDNELFEISATPLPANPDALARMRAKALAAASVTDSPPAEERGGADNTAMEVHVDELMKAKAALEEANKLLGDKDKTIAALTERIKGIEDSRADQQARADKLAAEIVERDLNELVGKKIAPAEKPGMVKLAALSPDLYAEQLVAIKARPDMNLLGAPIVGEDPAPPASPQDGADDSGKSFEDEVQKAIEAA